MILFWAVNGIAYALEKGKYYEGKEKETCISRVSDGLLLGQNCICKSSMYTNITQCLHCGSEI